MSQTLNSSFVPSSCDCYLSSAASREVIFQNFVAISLFGWGNFVVQRDTFYFHPDNEQK